MVGAWVATLTLITDRRATRPEHGPDKSSCSILPQPRSLQRAGLFDRLQTTTLHDAGTADGIPANHGSRRARASEELSDHPEVVAQFFSAFRRERRSAKPGQEPVDPSDDSVEPEPAPTPEPSDDPT